MNRRRALIGSMWASCIGLIAPGLNAQTQKKSGTADLEPVGKVRAVATQEKRPARTKGEDSSPEQTEGASVAGFEEAGHKWMNYDIARYMELPHDQSNPPQSAIIDWILRRHGSSIWHSDKVSALVANKTQVKAYHNPTVLKQVGEIVERFTESTSDILKVHIRFVAAADPRWRYMVLSRMNLLGGGPQGQQIWTMSLTDATMALTQMQVYQGFELLADQQVEMINGQTLSMITTEKKPYNPGLQRQATANTQSTEPSFNQLVEGVVLKFSPLLTYAGDAVDGAVELTCNTVKSTIKTRVLAGREQGANEATIDVPEVISSRLVKTIRWTIGQTLVISGGIHPGMLLKNKNGFLNLRIPGTVPTQTETLIFIDVETPNSPNRAANGAAGSTTLRSGGRGTVEAIDDTEKNGEVK
ncbi:MAG: hypothetical protein WCJ40_06995 [Planctomycetota bacterium]